MGKTVTGGGSAVAESGEKWLDTALSLNIVIVKLIDKIADVLEVLPAVNELLVVLGSSSYIEVIPPRPVPFCIDAVKGKTNYRIDIGTKRTFRPGRKYLT